MNHKYNTGQPKQTLIHESLRSATELTDSNRRWPSDSTAEMSDSTGPADRNDSEELIEDDYDSYDELFTQHVANETPSQLDGSEAVPTSQEKPPAKSEPKSANSIKRFLAQSKPASKPQPPPNPAPLESEALPLAQRYAPRNLEELAVHKRKVRDVEQWLNEAFAGKPWRNLLVLKGPAGSGKTTTISLLSDKLKFSVLEWKTPSTSAYAAQDYVSLGARFDGFLSRGHTFGSLDLSGHDGPETLMEDHVDTQQRRIILIEEFPALSRRTASVLAAFQLSVLRYISTSASTRQSNLDRQPVIPPIVMVVSETASNSDSPFENLTVHRLLGRQIYNHPSTTIIEFNSIASTIMQKALNLILKRSARQPPGNHAQSQTIIASISKIGDIRNAVASLEFLCLGSGAQGSWNDQTTKKPSRTDKKKTPVSNEALEEIAQREANIGLYHAVGKLVYNKRDNGSSTDQLKLPSPPTHLRDHERLGVSQVHVNELLDETGTDTQSFIGALHENFVPSCHGPSFTDSLDGCTAFLSDSDVLCVNRKGNSRSQAGLGTGFLGFGAGVDLLRQEELSYQVAARGLLFALPCPVNRQMSNTDHTKRTNDAHKLFWPPSIRLVRQFEETRGLIDSWGDALLGSTLRPAAVLLQGPVPTTRARGPKHPKIGEEDSASAVPMMPRNDLILHQLPYMAIILGDAAESGGLQDIVGLTRNHNTGYNSQRDEEFASGSSLEGYNTLQYPRRGKDTRRFQPEADSVPQADDEQLILSDDDIVDDP